MWLKELGKHFLSTKDKSFLKRQKGNYEALNFKRLLNMLKMIDFEENQPDLKEKEEQNVQKKKKKKNKNKKKKI